MQKYAIGLLYCFLTMVPLSAQHTLTISPGDTVHLDMDTWRGDLQWQLSHDSTSWSDIADQANSTLTYVPGQFPSYFRGVIIENNCAPHFSEVVKVDALVLSKPTVETQVPGNISPTSAEAGGNIIGNGGASITARGVVYSTTANPGLDDDMYTSDGNGDGSFESNLTGLAPNTTYYMRAYATNSEGTAYGDEHSFTTSEEGDYSIGDEGPAGGIIFYDKGSYSNGWRYLEAAPVNWSGGADPWVDLDWGCYETHVGGTSTDVGTGMENTDSIVVNGCLEENMAVDIAAGAEIKGYTDWFLPARDELYDLYHNLYDLGANFHSTYGFLTVTYASSSEINDITVWGIDFGAGSNVQHLKINTTIAVRPVRRF